MMTMPIADEGTCAIEVCATTMIAAASVVITYFMRITRFKVGSTPNLPYRCGACKLKGLSMGPLTLQVPVQQTGEFFITETIRIRKPALITKYRGVEGSKR